MVALKPHPFNDLILFTSFNSDILWVTLPYRWHQKESSVNHPNLERAVMFDGLIFMMPTWQGLSNKHGYGVYRNSYQKL